MKRILLFTMLLALLCSVTVGALEVDAVSKPKQITSLSITNKTEQGKGIIKVAYKKVKGAKGYLIKYSTNSKYKNAKYKRIKNVTTLAATIKNLKSDKKYYVKVRAYKTSGGKYIYGKYSKTKTAYTYKTPQKVTSLKLSNKTTESTGKVKVTYKKTSYASGYQIKYSTSSKFKNSKNVYIKGKSTTSKTISGLKTNKTYYIKVRAYRTKNSKKYYGPYSKVLKVATDAPKSLVKTFVLDDYRNKPYTNDSYVLKELKANLDKGRPNTTITDIHQDTVTMYNLNFNPYELGVDTHEKLETIRAWYYLIQDLINKNMENKQFDIKVKENESNLFFAVNNKIMLSPAYIGGSFNDGYFSVKEFNLCNKESFDVQEYIFLSILNIIEKAKINTTHTIAEAFTKVLEQMALRSTYRIDLNSSQRGIYNFLKNGVGACGEYALLAEKLFATVGIKIEYFEGLNSQGIPHAWNKIIINNTDYYFDLSGYSLDMTLIEIKQFYEDNPNYIITGYPEWWYYELQNIIKTKSEMEATGKTFY